MKIDTLAGLIYKNTANEKLAGDKIPNHKQSTLSEKFERLSVNGDLQGAVAIIAKNSEDETAELISFAASHPLLKGVIGYTDLLADDLPERLDHFRKIDSVVGFTHYFRDSKTLSQLTSSEFVRGVKVLKVFNYPFDLILDWSDISMATSFVDKLPGVKIALSFEENQGRRNSLNRSDWKSELKELSFSPDLYFKVPGRLPLKSENHKNSLDSSYLFESLLNIIGPDRIMFGSHWPVNSESSYSEISDNFAESIAYAGAEITEKILCRNSLEFYGITV